MNIFSILPLSFREKTHPKAQLKTVYPTFCFWVFFWMTLSNCLVAPVYSQDLDSLIAHGGYILTDKNRPELISKSARPRETFIPASTIKIVTALAALKTLGPEYRFTTSFYYDTKHRLYIKGGGDPFLISEEINAICLQLKHLGITEISSLVLDASSYNLTHSAAPGTENTLQPYDAHNGALVVNFNTVGISVDQTGKIFSSEPQTPTLPLMSHIDDLKQGDNRININQLKGKNVSSSLQYAGELFTALLKKNGIHVLSDSLHAAIVPQHLEAILHWQSRFTLQEVLEQCLHFSNNFIANQIFLKVGEMKYASPATWEKGRRAVHLYISQHTHIPQNELYMEEGAGLSRRTRISPQALLDILYLFEPYHTLLRFNTKDNTFFKTGTLLDVYCLAGYISQPRGLQPFVILLNQKKNTRQDILNALFKQN